MSLVPRKPRPLQRDRATYRDDRLFLIACDDTYAPKQYFDFFRLTRVQVHVVPTEDGSSAAIHVLRRLLEFEVESDDERWLLLDTDHYAQGTHLDGLMETLQEARRRGIQVALSKPSFELWLLLHHAGETEVKRLPSGKDVVKALRECKGNYNKTKLRREDYPASAVRDACARAERLDATVEGGDIPQGNTTRVYKLWKAIASKAGPAQLPVELKGLCAGN